MKKKKYITPNVEIVTTKIQQVLLDTSAGSSMDSDDSGWEEVENPSGTRRNSTGFSEPFNSDWNPKW